MTYRELIKALMSLPEDAKDLEATVWRSDHGTLSVEGFTAYDRSKPISVDNPPDIDVLAPEWG